MRKFLFNFVWNLRVRERTVIGAFLGVGIAVLANRLLCWPWQISFLSGYILGLGTYLALLVIVILHADGPRTQERFSKDQPKRLSLMVLVILVSIFGVGTVAQLLTAVGKHALGHSRLLQLLSVVAVLLAWFHLHTAFGVHYARLYYELRISAGALLRRGNVRVFVSRAARLPIISTSSMLLLPWP